MDIKTLEDGTVVISTPNSLSPKLSPNQYKAGFCHQILKYYSAFTQKSVCKYFVPFLLLFLGMVILVTFKDYAKTILFWIEKQPPMTTFVVMILLFTLASFPVVVGYLVLIISSGYLLGMFKGLITVILGANLGVFVAHNTIKAINTCYPIQRFIKNETGRAILRVIAGPRQFKIVLFCRLSPIPFGLQNTIFGISSVKSRNYHPASLLGLLPAQTVNVYFGSKLKQIHDVFNDHHTALASYGVFVVEVLIGIALMLWIIQKARNELSNAISDMDVDEKLLIEVQS